MKLKLNGAFVDVPLEKPSVALALAALGYHAFHAVAVNGECVLKREREEKILVEGDEMEVLSPQQGG